MRKGTKLQMQHANYFNDVMQQVTWDIHETALREGEIPQAWHQIARHRGPREKTRLTLRVEADVVKFFRAMGRGYQERMNDVLRAWMHGRLAGLIDGPEAEDVEAAMLGHFPRPRIGDTEMAMQGIVRKEDGRLWSMEEDRYVGEEEMGVFRSRRG